MNNSLTTAFKLLIRRSVSSLSTSARKIPLFRLLGGYRTAPYHTTVLSVCIAKARHTPARRSVGSVLYCGLFTQVVRAQYHQSWREKRVNWKTSSLRDDVYLTITGRLLKIYNRVLLIKTGVIFITFKSSLLWWILVLSLHEVIAICIVTKHSVI